MFDFQKTIKILLYCFVIGSVCSCASKRVVEKDRVELPVYKKNASLNLDPSSEELGILTYNIKAIGTKNVEETNAFIEYARAEDFSILLLQEVFSEKTRQYILDSLENKYSYQVDRVDYSGFWRSICHDAGLMILSKYPMVDISDIQFGPEVENKGHFFHQFLPKEVSITLDFMSNKSILGTLVELPNESHLLAYTTHTQAFGSPKHKSNQYRIIYEFIEKSVNELVLAGKISPDKTAIILTGDLNTNSYWEKQYSELLKQLNQPNDIHLLHNKEREEYTFSASIFNMLFRFDYIFNYDRIGEYNLLPLEIKSAKVTDIRVKGKSISDHLPMISVLRY